MTSPAPILKVNAKAIPWPNALRTNCTEQDPQKLWHWYIQLTEVEDAFRTGKADLGLRPVYHQKPDRVQAHIFIRFLALAMWRCLEMWLKAKV
jgi:transposase